MMIVYLIPQEKTWHMSKMCGFSIHETYWHALDSHEREMSLHERVAGDETYFKMQGKKLETNG